MNKKRMWIILAGSVLAISALGLGYTVWPSRPPDPAGSPQDVAAYVASNKFARLSADDKQAYLRQAGPGLFRSSRELSDEQRQKLRENIGPVFRQGMEDRINKYFELPPEEQIAYLDEMIDRMEAMRQAHPPRASAGSDGQNQRPRGRGGFTPARMKNRIENTSPEHRAKMAAFRKAMSERRKQRGLSGPR